MHILIFEPTLSGHHANYLKYIIQAAREITSRITVITQVGYQDLAEYHLHLQGQMDGVVILNLEDSTHLNGIRRDIYRYNLLKESIATLKPDVVWIPLVDRLAQIAGIMRYLHYPLFPKGKYIPVVGLIFRGADAYNFHNWLGSVKNKLSLKLATLAPLHALYTVDNILYEHLKSRGCAHVRLMPEAVEPPAMYLDVDLREKLNLPCDPEARFIVSLGGQNHRKGVDLLINGFLQSKPRIHDYLILAGKVNSKIAALLEDKRGHPLFAQLIVRDAMLTELELEYYLSVADYITVPYPEHVGSSSFLLRAVSYKKPLIASDTGWIGHTSKQYNLGFTCTVSDISQFSQLLSDVFSGKKQVEDLNSNFDVLTRFHTVENFKNTWINSIL